MTTFTPCITKAGEAIQTARLTADTIPADWTKKAVLTRPCGMNLPERFAFFALPDGRVAQVSFHPMNGPDDLFCRIGRRDFMAGQFQELLDGEPYRVATDYRYGQTEVRQGRRVKAHRVA